MKIGFFIFTVIFSLFFNVACERPLRQDMASVNILIPDMMKLQSVNALALPTGILSYVVINIRGTGIDIPISVNYDSEDKGNRTALPVNYSLEVPPGAARLIQILAVYMDPETDTGHIYYGDVTKDLVRGDNSISLPIDLEASESLKGGRVAGRYFAADGSNPSGLLEARYQPRGGKPPVVIASDFMLNGWFSMMALTSLPLDIVLAGRELKIFSGLKLSMYDSASLQDNKKMKVVLPIRYSVDGDGTVFGADEQASLIGFFGPGVPDSAKVCYASDSFTYTRLFKDSNKTYALMWSATSTDSSDVHAEKTSEVALCGTSDLSEAFKTVLPFNPATIDHWGGPEAVQGFVGVFRFPTGTASGGSPVQVSYDSAGQYSASFSVLPGTFSVADSINIYYRSSNSPRDYYQNGGSAACRKIANGELGFKSIGTIPLVAANTDYKFTSAAPADINQNAVMAFCPMKNAVAVGAGYAASYLMNSASGGGGGNGGGGSGGVPVAAANSFSAFTGEFGTVGVNQCHRLYVNLIQENPDGSFNYNVSNSTSRVISITATSTPALANGSISNGIALVGMALVNTINFFSNEADCRSTTGTLVSSVTIPANTTHAEIWYKDSVPENVTVNLTSNSFNTQVRRLLNVSVQTPTAPTRLQVPFSINIGPNECQSFDIYAVDSNNIPTNFSTATAVSLNKKDLSGGAVTNPSFEFYDSCTSQTAITSLTFNTNEFKKNFVIKTGSAPSGDRRIEFSYDMNGTTRMVFSYLNPTPVADHVGIMVNNGNPVYEGSCVPLKVQALNSSGSIVTAANFDFNMGAYNPSANNGYGYFSTACSTSGPWSFNFNSGENISASFSAVGPGAAPAAGIKMGAYSVFFANYQETIVPIKASPPYARLQNPSATLKVHLMSDELSSSSGQTGISGWPSFVSGSVYMANNFVSVNYSTTPRTLGALFTSSTSAISGPISGNVSDNVMMTIKFKLDSLPSAGSTADLLSLDTGTGSFKIYLDDQSNSTFKIKGSGGWVGPDVAANTWYTVSLNKNALGGTYGYINGANIGPGTNGNPAVNGTIFTNFRVGTGFIGSVKAVIIDIGGDVYSDFNITGEHAYINQRVPE